MRIKPILLKISFLFLATYSFFATYNWINSNKERKKEQIKIENNLKLVQSDKQALEEKFLETENKYKQALEKAVDLEEKIANYIKALDYATKTNINLRGDLLKEIADHYYLQVDLYSRAKENVELARAAKTVLDNIPDFVLNNTLKALGTDIKAEDLKNSLEYNINEIPKIEKYLIQRYNALNDFKKNETYLKADESSKIYFDKILESSKKILFEH